MSNGETRTQHEVLTGTICRWYPNGDTNGEPRVAIMMRDDPNGIADLAIIKPYARTLDSMDGVRHRDDPWLESHIAHRHENGVWDYGEVANQPAAIPLDTLARQIIKELGGKAVILRAITEAAKEDKK